MRGRGELSPPGQFPSPLRIDGGIRENEEEGYNPTVVRVRVPPSGKGDREKWRCEMGLSESEARKLHDDALVFDMLTMPDVLEEPIFSKMRDGGVDAIHCTAAITEDFKQAMEGIERIYARVDSLPDVVIVTKVSEIEEAKREGKLAVLLGFQDTAPLEGRLSNFRPHVKSFYRAGIRCMQLTYTGANSMGSGCGEYEDVGITWLGKEMIEEMNSLGILIDLSHSGQKTTLQTTEYSKKPVAYTHANSKTVCDNERNKNDDCLKKLGEKNGIIGVTALPRGVRLEPPRTLEHMIDHIDYIRDFIGIDHVGIGLDLVEGYKEKKEIPEVVVFWRTRRPDIFGSVDDWFEVSYPEDIDSSSCIPNITMGLAKRGYSEEDIRKILGLNALRVLRDTIG